MVMLPPFIVILPTDDSPFAPPEADVAVALIVPPLIVRVPLDLTATLFEASVPETNVAPEMLAVIVPSFITNATSDLKPFAALPDMVNVMSPPTTFIVPSQEKPLLSCPLQVTMYVPLFTFNVTSAFTAFESVPVAFNV